MAKSVLSSDTLPKAGRVNEGMLNYFFIVLSTSCHLHPFVFFVLHSGNIVVCREWLVHEDGALAYRLQDEESKSILKNYRIIGLEVLILNFL